MKSSVKIGLLVVALLGSIFAFVYMNRAQIFRSRASGGSAVLSIVASGQAVGIGNTGTANVFLNPGGANVSAVELVMTYDSTKMNITGIAPGTFFTGVSSTVGSPVEITKNFSTPGTIHYAVGFPLGSHYSSSTPSAVVVITYKGVSAGTTTLNFVTSGQPNTNVQDNTAQNVLSDTNYPGTITISGGGARLFFSDVSTGNQVIVGSNFTTNVLADTSGKSVDGIDAIIHFDPSVLQIASLKKGTDPALTSYPALTFDNTQGIATISANIGAGASPTPATGPSLNIGNITFAAKTVSSGSPIAFDFISPGNRNDSNIVLAGSGTSGGTDILASVNPLSIIVVNATIPANTPTSTPTSTPTNTPTSTPTNTPTSTPTSTPTNTPTATPILPPGNNNLTPQTMIFKLNLQGRTSATNVTLTYKSSAGTINTLSLPMTNSQISVPLDPDTYTFLIHVPGYLTRRFDTVQVTQGSSSIDLSANQLLGGDINRNEDGTIGNGVINSLDYTEYLNTYGTNDPVDDLDGSGQVNSLDFDIMRANWPYTADVLP